MNRLILFSILSLALGFGLSLGLTAILGEDPLLVASVLFHGAFGSWTNLGYSLYYATPLFLTGLSVSWAFRAGLFNIGAEGQMTLGGVAMIAFGLNFSYLPFPISILGAMACGFLAGGIWGALAGLMKAYKNVHEVLSTILLNFVAYGVTGYLILNVYRNSHSQVPETLPLSESYRLPQALELGYSPLNSSFLIAVALLALAHFILTRTRFGFYQRMTGGGQPVGALAGVNMKTQIVTALFISGGIAGLASIPELLGNSLKAREGFTGGVGFVGIAVCLLGQQHPLGIAAAAFLFGALHKGSLDLDLDTQKVTRDLSVVIQALIIIFVSAQQGLQDLVQKFQGKTQDG